MEWDPLAGTSPGAIVARQMRLRAADMAGYSGPGDCNALHVPMRMRSSPS